MTFSATDLTPAIGTEVGIDTATLGAGSHAPELRRLLEQRGVLVFRELHLTDEQQVRVAASMGTIREEGKNGIFKVTLDPAVNGHAEYLIGSFNWHIDGTHDDVPCLASFLSGRKLSPTGGQTEFANTYAAYDALSDDEKRQCNGLRVVHTVESSQRAVHPDPTDEQLAAWHRFPPQSPSTGLDASFWSQVVGARQPCIARRGNAAGTGAGID